MRRNVSGPVTLYGNKTGNFKDQAWQCAPPRPASSALKISSSCCSSPVELRRQKRGNPIGDGVVHRGEKLAGAHDRTAEGVWNPAIRGRRSQGLRMGECKCRPQRAEDVSRDQFCDLNRLLPTSGTKTDDGRKSTRSDRHGASTAIRSQTFEAADFRARGR